MAFDSKLLDGMVLFAEVVKAGSFTQAAERSGHSTSYISKEISALESRLGVRLLHRTTRSLTLTPDGRAYFNTCEQIIQDASDTRDLLQGRQQQVSGTLRLSCPVTFGIAYLRPLLHDFMQAYPAIELELDLNDRKVDLVAEGVDVAIRGAVGLADSSLISRPLLSSPTLTLASPGYLAKAGLPSHPTELSRHRTLCYSYLKDPNLWPFIGPDGEAIQVRVTPKVLTNSPQMELAMCVAGEGIMRMPAFNLTDELQSGKLQSLLEDYQAPEIKLYLVYPGRKHLASRVRCFIDFMLERMPHSMTAED